MEIVRVTVMKIVLSFLVAMVFFFFCWLMFLFCSSAQASDGKTKLNVQSYGLILSQNRIIFPQSERAMSITVKNPQNYPVLVHSRVLTEDKKAKGGFMITPPLFRLDAGRANVIKIMSTGGNFPSDREQLEWLCVKGIPPKQGDEWARMTDEKVAKNERNMTLMLAVDNCIKLLVRPDNLPGGVTESSGRLIWKVTGSDLVVHNPTAYYMNLSSIKLGDATVPPDYVAPFAERRFPLPKGVKQGTLSWKVLTDFGGESQVWTAPLR